MKPREIKFRAWDGKGIFNEGIPTMHQNITELTIFDSLWHDDDIAKIQYTGLKDKNGKQIFEGDVVRCGLFVGEVIYIDYPTFNHANYINVGFYLKAQINDEPHLMPFDQYLIENGYIVGNIFENPKLLNQK